MALLIVLLLVLLVLAFVVTGPTGDYMVPGRAYRDYRLEGFSYWLRDHIVGPDNWGNIRACLADSAICSKLNNQYVTAEQFFAADLSPIQSGCCKPPTICGYQYMNPTLWINPTNGVVDVDCSIWNNDPNQLCYNCDSCKGGLLGNLRKEWKKSNLILIITLVILISVYLIGCCAYKNTLTKSNSKGKK
uniref:Putative tetraspanin-2-like n=1 Tax=Solanum chacoense TaxID=4108 RepID=A0A0V0H305_SOLCH